MCSSDLAPHVTPAGADPVSHLVYAACASDVRDVFVDGRALVLGHELVTVSVDEIVRGRAAAPPSCGSGRSSRDAPDAEVASMFGV